MCAQLSKPKGDSGKEPKLLSVTEMKEKIKINLGETRLSQGSSSTLARWTNMVWFNSRLHHKSEFWTDIFQNI